MARLRDPSRHRRADGGAGPRFASAGPFRGCELGCGGLRRAAVFDDERSAAPPAANGWAISGTLAGSVSFLGTLGGLFAVGFDGLWVGLGLTSGVVLAAALVAPSIRRIGCRSIPQFMDLRYGGWVRGLTFAVIMSAAVLILAAVFSMLGQAAALLTGTVPVAGIAVAAALVLAVLLRGGAAAGLTLAVLGVVIVAGLITVSGALGGRTAEIRPRRWPTAMCWPRSRTSKSACSGRNSPMAPASSGTARRS